ncbi:MAG: DUF2804 family protein [Acidimicrobiia bacterium]|nr:DUF2804 family protein [Acidimicrobiia bacterium]
MTQELPLVVDGRVRFGRWSEPFPDINLRAADAYRLPFGLPAPRPLQQARLKEWQAFQFTNGRWFGIVALFNAKALALAQLKLVDTESLTKYTFEQRLAPWALRYPQNLLHGVAEWSGGEPRFVSTLTSPTMRCRSRSRCRQMTPVVPRSKSTSSAARTTRSLLSCRSLSTTGAACTHIKRAYRRPDISPSGPTATPSPVIRPR